MKRKHIAVLLSLLLALPMVLADSRELLDDDILVGQSASYVYKGHEEVVKVVEADVKNNKCLVTIDNSEPFWIYKSNPLFIGGFKFWADVLGDKECEIRVKVIDDVDDDVDDDYYVHNANVITAIITEGDDVDFDFGSINFNVEVLIIEDTENPTVSLNVDGQVLTNLHSGDNHELNYESLLIVKDIYFKDKDMVMIEIKTPGSYLNMGNMQEGNVGEAIAVPVIVNIKNDCDKDFVDCIEDGFTDDYCRSMIDKCIGNFEFQEVDNAMPIDNSRCPSTQCKVNGNCVPLGTRMNLESESKYCDISGKMQVQKVDGDIAENDYECESNSAKYGECENVREQTNILNKMFGWLSKIFGGK